jgi:hypothetical protein
MAVPMDISCIVSMANMAITIAFLLTYTKIYSKTRVMFTIGLVVFAGMLLLHKGIAVYEYLAMAPLYSDKSLLHSK